jgi:hypothetical protein
MRRVLGQQVVLVFEIQAAASLGLSVSATPLHCCPATPDFTAAPLQLPI